MPIAHFTVTGGKEAVDTTFLLYYVPVSHVVLMLTILILLNLISIRKGKSFVSKQGQPQPHVHSKLGYLAHNCKMIYLAS